MKKVLISLIFMLFLCINVNAEEIISGNDFQVNPLYEHLNIDRAPLYNATINGVTYTECTDFDDALRYLTEQSEARNTNICLSYTSEISENLPSETIHDLALDEAIELFTSLGDYSEFDKNGASSDYLYYQWLSRNIYYLARPSSDSDNVTLYLRFSIEWFTTPAQIAEENAKIEEILNTLDVYNEDEYTQVKAVHDYIINNAKYVSSSKYNTASQKDEHVIYHSSYSALIMGETVCQGYATAIYRLLRELGISCRVVPGNVTGGRHAWNMVRIGSYYYLIDATWDDQLGNKGKYFLKAQYSDHTADYEFTTTAFKRFFPMAEEDYTETLYYTPNAPQNISVTENGESVTLKFDLDYTSQYAAVYANDEPLYLAANSIVNDTTTHTITHTPQNGETIYEIAALRVEYNSRTEEELHHTNVAQELYFNINGNLTEDIEITQIPSGITTITGATSSVTVTLPAELILEDDLTFDNLILSGTSTIYANGHKLTITDTVTSDARLIVYGGGKNTNVTGDTYLNLNGGLYQNVYGGCYKGTVTGNTTVIFGGNANKGDVFTSSPCKVYGGGNYGAVTGTTSVTLKDNAVALYLVGSGVNTGGTCNGTNINIQGGSVMNVYAGSTNVVLPEGIETKIVMTGGKAEALFGGSESKELVGHTRIYLLGGHITRRIYTGCYNGTDNSGNCQSDRYVKGTTALYIGPSATINTSISLLDKETVNTGVFIGSRTTSSHSDEINAVIYLDDCYSTHNKYIGEKHLLFTSKFKSFENYIIKDGLNGTVEFTTDGKLKLIPDKKYSSLFNDTSAKGVVSIPQKTNTATYEKLKLYLGLIETADNSIKLDIVAEEPAFLFTGTYLSNNLQACSFKQAKTEEKEIELTENSQTKFFLWTNGLKPLAEPIIR